MLLLESLDGFLLSLSLHYLFIILKCFIHFGLSLFRDWQLLVVALLALLIAWGYVGGLEWVGRRKVYRCRVRSGEHWRRMEGHGLCLLASVLSDVDL
jgi:hypothetical protein